MADLIGKAMNSLLYRAIEAVPRGLLKTRGAKSGNEPPGGLPHAERKFRFHDGILITPRIPREVGELVKENWVVGDQNDLSRFNHFLPSIFHPGRLDPEKPVVLLVPGMLTNGNLFRILRNSVEGGNYRNLDSPLSYANALAFKGFRVVLVYPRYSRWAYTRGIDEMLGVPNCFSDKVNVARLASDLQFYIDAALGLSRAKKIVVQGFSLGGIELLYLLAFGKLDPRIAGMIFLATPVDFKKDRRTLIGLLTLYGFFANYLPTKHYHALNIIARNVDTLKDLILKFAPDEISSDILKYFIELAPLLPDILNTEKVDPQAMLPLYRYVLEPQPSALINDLFYFLKEGALVRPDTEEEFLENVPGDIPPSLVVRGEEDKITTEESDLRLFGALGTRDKKRVAVPGAGHVDLIIGQQSQSVLDETVRFMEGL